MIDDAIFRFRGLVVLVSSQFVVRVDDDGGGVIIIFGGSPCQCEFGVDIVVDSSSDSIILYYISCWCSAGRFISWPHSSLLQLFFV